MPLPQALPTLTPVPHGRTARRLDWRLLPPQVRALVEQRIGFRVVAADSAGSGFTPGFASVLHGPDGERVFVKAASTQAQRPFAEAYRAEAATLRALPDGLPVPRLLWSHEDDLWVLLAQEYVDGTPPARPFPRDELDACLNTLELLAERLDGPAAGPDLPTFADDFAHFLSGWQHVRRFSPAWPHLEEAAALADRVAEATAGTAVVHTDARDDNFLITPDGRAVLCDWNWTVRGAPWIDTVLLLATAHGDGHPVEEILATRRLTRDVPADDVDSLLALVCGYMLECRDRPVPNSSPYLRVHARWYSEVCWDWLARRRGW